MFGSFIFKVTTNTVVG